MRVTLDIDDDLLVRVRELARAQDRTMGEVVSELMRRGLSQPATVRIQNGFPVFDPGPDAPLVGLEDVERALEE